MSRLHAYSPYHAQAVCRLALTKTDLPVYESAPGGMCEEEDSEQDLSLEAVAARASLMSEETFAAGDWVQYEHPIMKFSVKSRVVEVCPSATLPLVLESDEVHTHMHTYAHIHRLSIHNLCAPSVSGQGLVRDANPRRVRG